MRVDDCGASRVDLPLCGQSNPTSCIKMTSRTRGTCRAEPVGKRRAWIISEKSGPRGVRLGNPAQFAQSEDASCLTLFAELATFIGSSWPIEDLESPLGLPIL